MAINDMSQRLTQSVEMIANKSRELGLVCVHFYAFLFWKGGESEC